MVKGEWLKEIIRLFADGGFGIVIHHSPLALS